MKKNIAGQNVGAEMITALDGSDFSGTVSVFVTIDSGTQTAGGGGAVVSEGNGYYSYTPTQTETNGDHLAFTFAGTNAITVTVQVYTTFPQSVDNNTILATLPLATDIVSAGAITTLSGVVVNVDTVDSTTTNLDMRGTDSALLAANYTAPDNAGITANGVAIAALNDFNPVTDPVANVTLVATTSVNSDMRGTDNAMLDASYTAPDNAGIAANGVAIANLNDISALDVLTAGDIDGYSLEESQRLILAVNAGQLSGATTSTITIQAADNSKPRVLATVDTEGNRIAVTKDASA